MRHYTRDEKLKVVQLYIKYDKSPAVARYELGYPGKSALCEWFNEDLTDSDSKWFCKRNSSVVRCSQEQKDQAIIA